MTMEDASLKILQTDPTSRESMEEGRSGKDLQRKCLQIASPLIPLYCCISIIMVLATGVVVLSTFLAVRNTKPVLHVLYVTCPKEWIGFGSKCFYFSEDTKNWTSSQTFCTSLEAVLAQFETEEELNFLRRYKGPSDHWIGLRRESSHHAWKWTDSTEYNASFFIKGFGECAYLNDLGLNSARSYTAGKKSPEPPVLSSCCDTDSFF
ncbi:C-type lectin domain family 2 member D isoform X2 [Physeter macrocephalus]|uniref:C-type lectin domain family 2 member D isoform X2 n=1 Tax=Physeter macrocephalus TaxID=9755 RepID=A0A9W2WQJ3_PHYMC|nr:C-type lectin domain family 2 member D isoform X2 [Physeter catodon]|eukprot:XP_028346798.1 C-type lectin domain family 2 member D isoform X2 [Physeter catodon]